MFMTKCTYIFGLIPWGKTSNRRDRFFSLYLDTASNFQKEKQTLVTQYRCAFLKQSCILLQRIYNTLG